MMNFFGSSAPAANNPPANAEGSNEHVEIKEGSVGQALPEQHQSAFFSFLKQVASFTGDLSQLTCPAFLLSGTSLTEYSCNWSDHPDLFAEIDQGADSLERMVRVTRWFTSTLYGSYAVRCEKGTEKKPFNPVLGEQFKCHWEDPNSPWERQFMICEQVSHHPPIGAFYLENTKRNMCLNGAFGQRSRFKGTSVKVEQVGSARLLLLNHNKEEYTLQFPDVNVRGLFSGHIFLELTGETHIKSQFHFAIFEFIAKPWFSGEYHTFKVHIYDIKDTSRSRPLYTGHGKWTGKSTIVKNDTHQEQLLFDAVENKIVQPIVPPIEEQNDLESRKLWHKVTQAILTQNYSVATKEKTEIEEKQRALRRERKENNVEWMPELFFDPDAHSGSSQQRPRSHSSSRHSHDASSSDHAHHGDEHSKETVHWTYKESLHLKEPK